MTINFEQMPAAVGQILDRLTRLEAVIGEQLFSQKESESSCRLVKGAEGLARYLKDIPKSTVYGMRHRGLLDPAIRRMPGSRALYFDLDAIDALMAKKEVAA